VATSAEARRVSRETDEVYNGAVPRETIMNTESKLTHTSEWLGIAWSSDQLAMLVRFEHWLSEEAIVAGGIGPDEGERIFDRHIADSLAFLALIERDTATIVDVGSGVGLPAIPLAIALPNTNVTIVDRSERRTRLARRALRVLSLENVEVITADIDHIDMAFDVATFRASLRIEAAADAFLGLTNDEGTGIFAWSRKEHPKSPPRAPTGTTFVLVPEGLGVLDTPAWLLRMQRS
jgi:16S rRNA (guanine527-N7)-methyltransferase